MFTTFDKAIAALVAPIMSLLTLSNILPDSFNTPEVITSLTGFITAVVVYFVPNKAK